MSDDITSTNATRPDDERPAQILEFWEAARSHAGLTKISVVTGLSPTESLPPAAWSFGDDAELADALLGAVLDGVKTATSSALWEYEAAEERLPEVGDLGIVLDSTGEPKALVRTTSVEVVPFGDVGAEFAEAEGEDDGSVEAWRTAHEEAFRRTLPEGREFAADMPVVCERFEVRYPSLD